MPPLSNSRRERFCVLAVQGTSDTEAYKLAGFKAKEPGKAAFKLRKNTEVLARIRELQEAAADAEIMQLRERMVRLSRLGRVELGQFLDENGHIDPDKVARSQGVAEYTTKWYWEGVGDDAKPVLVEKLKLRDPVVSIKELNAIDQVYQQGPSQVASAIFNITVVSPEGRDLVQRVLDGERTE